MKYYVDTSIWRDYFENRTDRFRPLGEWALRFFQYCNENEHNVLYSNLVLEELEKYKSKEEIQMIFSVIKKKLLLKVEVKRNTIIEAKKLVRKGLHSSDAINAVLAKENDAVLIYRDKHFYEIQNFVEIKKPEEII